MKHPRAHRLVSLTVVSLAVILPAASARAADDVTIEPRERWSNLFGGREVELHYAIKESAALTDLPVTWALAVDSEPTVASGRVAVNASPAKPGALTIKFTTPPVRETVVLKINLEMHVLDK